MPSASAPARVERLAGAGDAVSRRWSRVLPPAILAGGMLLGAACSGAPTGPDHPFSMELLPLPFPAVVLGDSLRDPDGVATPLTAAVYDVHGDRIPDADVTFIVPGAGVTVLEGGYLFGDSIVGSDGRVRVYAQAGGLQSLPGGIYVVHAPDTLVRVAEVEQELEYSVLPTPDVSDPLTVRVARADDSAPSGLAGVGHWPVRYSLVVRGKEVTPGDSSLAWLVQEGSLTPATADTTSSNGSAALRVRVNPYNAEGIAGLDSVEVYVSTRKPGAPLAGSPVRFVVRLRRATTP